MLIASYWPQNMMDFFFVLAYPVVRNPGTFAVVWATYTIANLSNLCFFFDTWFRVRLYIKHYIIGFFTCKFPIQVPDNDDSDENPDERGHSNNKPAYYRRQIRFFFWRMISQYITALFYLAISPVLRFALNKRWFLFKEMSATNYRNSMIFAASNLCFQVITGIVGFFFIRWKRHKQYLQVKEELKQGLTNFSYLGLVSAITTANAFISIAIILQHMKLWYAFTNGENTLSHNH